MFFGEKKSYILGKMATNRITSCVVWYSDIYTDKAWNKKQSYTLRWLMIKTKIKKDSHNPS